jgi:hypothetical protein
MVQQTCFRHSAIVHMYLTFNNRIAIFFSIVLWFLFFNHDPIFLFSIAITIMIKILIRINRLPVKYFSSVENLFSHTMKPPSCASSPPPGDGAYCDELVGIS